MIVQSVMSQRYAAPGWIAVFLWCLLSAGCATEPVAYAPQSRQAPPALQGSYHTVRRGETLWRIAYTYGLEAGPLAAANRLPSSARLNVGQRLFIPLPPESNRFLWPLRGSFGASSSGGLEISAAPGSLVRASRSGRVAVVTSRLSGWGKTVVVDHLDGYLTVYSGLEEILVAPGAPLKQGVPLGTTGSRAMHFQVRHGVKPTSALALLPAD